MAHLEYYEYSKSLTIAIAIELNKDGRYQLTIFINRSSSISDSVISAPDEQLTQHSGLQGGEFGSHIAGHIKVYLCCWKSIYGRRYVHEYFARNIFLLVSSG